MLKIEPLCYLVQIAHFKSLNIAAENLHLTQPTLSIAIKKLEQELNTKLLHRTYSGIILTEEGEYVVDQAQLALEYLKNIENYFEVKGLAHDNRPLDSITLYMTPAISLIQGPLLLKKLYKNNKTVSVTLEEHDNEIICTKLLDNNKAFGIFYCEENTRFDDRLVCHIISKSRSYLRFNKNTVLISPDVEEISLKEILNIPLVVPQTGYHFHNILMSLISRYGTPKIALVSPNFNIIQQMVDDDLAASFHHSLGLGINYERGYRMVAIKKAPRFILALLHNRNCDLEHILSINEALNVVFHNY